jgi:hypothetical protein
MEVSEQSVPGPYSRSVSQWVRIRPAIRDLGTGPHNRCRISSKVGGPSPETVTSLEKYYVVMTRELCRSEILGNTSLLM